MNALSALELADKLHNYFDSDYDEIEAMLRTIPTLEAEIEKHNRQLEVAKKLEYQKGYEFGSSLTTYNKPKIEALEAEIEALKKKITSLEFLARKEK